MNRNCRRRIRAFTAMRHHDMKTMKKDVILRSLDHDLNINLLRQHCISINGLVDDDIRRKVWPILAGSTEKNKSYTESDLKRHPSFHQVELDVNRLDSLLPADMDPVTKSETRSTMMRVVISVLLDNPELHYYQGFHDICYIFLSVLGEVDARNVLNGILPQRFGLFMEPSMDSTVKYMQLIFALLGHLRPELSANIEAVGLGPDFALAWVITWFAHVLPETRDIRRLYDLFLATDPLMLIYLSVAVIIRSDEEVESTTQDFGILHHTLLRLPKKHPVEDLVSYAVKLYCCVPPEQLLVLGKRRNALISSVRGNVQSSHIKPLRSDLLLYMGAAAVAAIAFIVYWWKSL